MNTKLVLDYVPSCSELPRFERFERDRMERMGMEGREAQTLGQRMSVQDMERMRQEGLGMGRYRVMGPGMEPGMGHGMGGHAPPHYKASYSESRL